MLDACEAVVAVWDGKSKGTAHTISEATKRGLPIYVHNILERQLAFEQALIDSNKEEI